MKTLPTVQEELSTHLVREVEAAKAYASEQHSSATRRAYRSDFAIFHDWCTARGLASMPAKAATVATFLGSRGFRPETVASLVVKKAGRVSRTGITHLRFAQEVEGLAVYGTYVKDAVNDDGELVHLIENLATPSSGGLMPTAIGVAEHHLVASPRRPGRRGVGRRHRLGLLTWVDRRVLAFQRD